MNTKTHDALWLTPWIPTPAYEGEDGPAMPARIKWQGWAEGQAATLRVEAGLDGDETRRSALITLWAAAQDRSEREGAQGECLVRDQDGAPHIPAITDVCTYVKRDVGSAWRPLDEVAADIVEGTAVHAIELCLTIQGPAGEPEVVRWPLAEAYVGDCGAAIDEIEIVVAHNATHDIESVQETLISGWGWVSEDYDSASPEVQQFWNRCEAITKAGRALGAAQEAKARAVGYAAACWVRPQMDTKGDRAQIEIRDGRIEVILTGAQGTHVRLEHTHRKES